MRTISPLGSAAAPVAAPTRPSKTIVRATRLPPFMASSPFRSIHQFFVQDVLHVVKPSIEIGGKIMTGEVGDLDNLARYGTRRMTDDQNVQHVPERAFPLRPLVTPEDGPR